MKSISLAKVSKGVNICLGISLGLFMLAMTLVLSTGAASAQSYNGHNRTCGHHKGHHVRKPPEERRAARPKKHSCHKHRKTEPAKPLESVPFAAEEMEVFQIVDTLTKAPTPPEPYIVGFAKAYFPVKDKIVIRFLAEYGSFESEVYGGFTNKYEFSPDYHSRYILPSEGNMPADGYDSAWMVIMDRTKHTFVESEHVRFNIREPENVRHPVG